MPFNRLKTVSKHSELPVSISNNANIGQNTTNNNSNNTAGGLLGEKNIASLLLQVDSTRGVNNQSFKTVEDKSKLKF